MSVRSRAARLALEFALSIYLPRRVDKNPSAAAEHVTLAPRRWSLMVFGESQACYTIRVMKQLGTTVGQKRR